MTTIYGDQLFPHTNCYYVSHVIKLTSADDFAKIYDEFRIQEETHRLSLFVANNPIFKDLKLGKIKVAMVSLRESAKIPRTFGYSDEVYSGSVLNLECSYFHQSYKLGAEMKIFDIEGMRYHVSSEVGSGYIEDYNFRITAGYNGIFAEVDCSYLTIYGEDTGYRSSTNMKVILKNLAKDLGVEADSDQALKWLLELFWGEIVNTGMSYLIMGKSKGNHSQNSF